MKVYVLTHCSYEDTTLQGVFTSIELAKDAVGPREWHDESGQLWANSDSQYEYWIEIVELDKVL